MEMTREDLISLGFRDKTEEGDDPFFMLILKFPFNFGVYQLAGSLIDGSFHLFGNDKYYTDKSELETVVNVFRK